MCIFISIFNILLFIAMKIFITGSNGFLGQHLCKYFLTKEANIIASGKGSKRIPFLNNDCICVIGFNKSRRSRK
jgi:nucleoside-diphosphate-sugar epimerase